MIKHPNIKRIDTDINHTHAWLVQVQRQGEIFIKMFSDNLNGGKRKALKAAIEFRDNTMTKASGYSYHFNRRTVLRRNNTSGIPGVGRYENVSNPKTKRVSIFWVAYWDDECGVRRQRKFMVSRYGEKSQNTCDCRTGKAPKGSMCRKVQLKTKPFVYQPPYIFRTSSWCSSPVWEAAPLIS